MLKKQYHITLTLLTLFLLIVSSCSVAPKHVVLFIGDGMGPEQVRAAGMYANGREGTLVFETFPYQTQMTTHSADDPITDSAAAATAMATGQKVNNGVISVAIPGDGADLQTLLEIFQHCGKAAGLVTTTNMTHATPAAFAAHQAGRNYAAAIADDYFKHTRPNVLFGAGEQAVTPVVAIKAGYIVVENAAEMQNLDTENVTYASGQFGAYIPYEYDGLGKLPHLSQMTRVALNILDNDPDGFFLMVEGGKIDWACHKNDLPRNIGETVEFANSVKAALDWAKKHKNTLIIITADHETGGLNVIKNNGKGKLPAVTWSTGGHTSAKVPVYAWGQAANLFTGRMDNTDIFKKIIKASTTTNKTSKHPAQTTQKLAQPVP